MLKTTRAFMAAALFTVSTSCFPYSVIAQTASQLPPGEQCFQATTGLNGMVGILGTIVPGSGGIAGTYVSVPLTGGSGTGATANITVAGGIVTQIVIQYPGTNYIVGDVLSASSSSIGNVTGFSVPVSSISINSSLAGGTVGMYIPGTLTVSQTWQDAAETILNNNPISLDANGCAPIFGSGTYRQIVFDSLGNEVWDKLTYSPVVSIAVDQCLSGGTITSAGTLSGNITPSPQTSASYTLSSSDKCKFISFSNTAPTAVTLPPATSSGFSAGWYVSVQNVNSGLVTITPATSTINGATSFLLPQGYGVTIISDGTNYETFGYNPLQVSVGNQGGLINKFRNGTMDIWQRGTSAITVTTAGQYTADGWIVIPTGASVTAQQAAGRLLTNYSLQITGASSATDVLLEQRIESYVAAPLSGQQVTVQAEIYNNTGATLTPTLTIKHPTTKDGFGTLTTDLAAAALQPCSNAVWTRVAYTFTASTNSLNGLQVAFDFGSLGTSSVQITELDIRAISGAPVGLASSPPPPELRPIFAELPFNQRYFYQGTSLFTVTGNAPYAGYAQDAVVYYPVPQRYATPVITLDLSGSGNAATSSIINIGTTSFEIAVVASGSGAFYASYLPYYITSEF